MKRSLTGELRVCSDALTEAHDRRRKVSRVEDKRVVECARLLRLASVEIADLQRQLDGSRAYARLLEKRLGIAA